ncbi:ornithine cyclodeaminase family protein [Ohessyouella blattaphilus]|uniref:Ornithine cyclodeaminase family protein n=1 Tax=Ohessyouella blattaphilus TaxID=2949333 RepID=A0ABT1EHB8_9FIRM|nr:ornithine cyclodeaminase family protein [Ohessyouella blattaphilus]MCP1110100.1 ornithine cyclodeaminase family protein [Ohessyouella blattaphilus]MCR8563494.1 ornithine cyclodeaminase family protein [Ohessyouella blattaphilus]
MKVISKEEIERLVDPNEIMDEIENAYRIFGSGKFFMPERPTVEDANKTMMYMPCYITDEIIGTKILSIFPDNGKLSLPTIDGVVLLNDYETGAPRALLDGQAVTAYRTGAVGGVAIRHLAKKNARSVGICGTGTQGFYQAYYACYARDIKDVYLYNHREKDLSEYINRLQKAIGREDVTITVIKDIRELVAKSDIICTTTLAKEPILPDDKELLRGKCIVAIGSYTPDKREIPDAIFALVDKVYIELPYAMEESGDLSIPLASGALKKENVVLMDQYLQSPAKRDITEGETTYFKSVGMALFDVCVANSLLNKASK